MSFTLKDQVLPIQVTDRQVAVLISQALRQEHRSSDAVVKRIARATNASPTTVRKWYEGQNAPSSANLLILMSTYDEVFQIILHILGRGDSTEADQQEQKPPSNALRQAVYGDRFVTINVVLKSKSVSKLNQRQLWFVGQLQQNMIVRAEDITLVWETSLRTARRDVAGLVKAKIIKYSGARKKGRFILRSP